MDAKDHTTHSGAYVCHRCGWPFPNPHPSAKHRRAHKKICGTIDGYNTNLAGSQVVSDDDKEKTPSPKIEKKMNIGGDEGGGGTRVSFSRSEDELFSDAVTEFSDSGSANKTLHRDLFFSFNDAENDEFNKVDSGIEVSEKIGTHVEKSGETEITTICDSSKSNLEFTETGLVKDGVMGHAPEQSHISHSQEIKSVDATEAGEVKGQTSEISTKEAKDSELTQTSPEVSRIVGGCHDNVKQEMKSDCEHVSEVVNEHETVEETNIEKFESKYEISPEIVKESETEVVSEEIKHEKSEPDHKHAPEEAKEYATVENVSILVGKEDLGASKVQIQESFKEPVVVLTEKKDLEAQELGTSSIEHIQEVVKEPDTVLTEKEDLGGPHLEKQINEQTVVTEKQDLGSPKLEKSSREQIQEVVKQPNTVLTEKEDLGGPNLEKQIYEQTHEVFETLISVVTEKQDLGSPELEKSSREQIQEVVKQPDTVLTEKEDLGGPHLEKQLHEQTHEGVETPISAVTEKQDLGPLKLEKSSKDQIQEVVKQPDTVLTEKEDLGGSHLEKQLHEQTHEGVETPISVVTEKQDLGPLKLEKSSKDQIQEVVKQLDSALTEKEDLGGPHLVEQSNEANHEVVENFDSVLIESRDLGAPKVEKCSKEHVVEPNVILTKKEDFGALKSENCSKDEVIEQKADNDSSVVADVSIDKSVVYEKNASDVVHVPIVEEGKMHNQDSGAALSVASSSRSSLEGNWGSVSVLSTASVDAGTLQSTEKSKVNSGKSNAATSDVYEPPSFMTLVETESKDKKPESSKAQDSQKQQNPEVSQVGWFPTMVKVNNESEGRKRNAEAIAKVTNWSTGKQSAPLKNLLGEAKSSRGTQPEPVVKKDEATVNPSVNVDVSSPPKLIDDDKKGKKKVKGISSWVPFVCCSSVNVVN